jgi:ribosomal protein L13
MGNGNLRMKDMLVQRKPRYHFFDGEKIEGYGRFLTGLAGIIQGKDSLHWQKNIATKDFIVIVNAKKIKVNETRHYYKHSGYVGGLTKHFHQESIDFGGERARYILKRSLANMLPGRSQKRQQMRQIKFFDGVPGQFVDLKSKTAVEQEKILRQYWRNV